MVVLGHRHDEPGRVAFRIAHEAGHIAKGDCTPDAPVVDEDEEILQDDEMEELADEYAVRALMGEATIPEPGPRALGNFRDLANRAAKVAEETGVDAGSIIFSWRVRRATTRLPPGPRKPCTSQPEPPESYGSASRGS